MCTWSLIAQKNDVFEHFPTRYQVAKYDSYSIRYNYICENTYVQPDSLDVSKPPIPQYEVLLALGPCGSAYMHYICGHFRSFFCVASLQLMWKCLWVVHCGYTVLTVCEPII